MPKFRVMITQNVTRITYAEVEGDDPRIVQREFEDRVDLASFFDDPEKVEVDEIYHWIGDIEALDSETPA